MTCSFHYEQIRIWTAKLTHHGIHSLVQLSVENHLIFIGFVTQGSRNLQNADSGN